MGFVVESPIRTLDVPVSAICCETVQRGDCIIVVSSNSNIYNVERADPTNRLKMPMVGLVIEKKTATKCRIQFAGIIKGIFGGGLSENKPLFVGKDGRPTTLPPIPMSMGHAFIQNIGISIGPDSILLVPNPTMTKVIE